MSRLAALSPRERLLVLVVLPLVVVAAAWRFAWVPLQDVRDRREAAIAEARLIAVAAASADDLPAPDQGPRNSRPLAARVTESAEALGLDLSRLEPEGDALRVTIAEVPFAALVLWLADLEESRGIELAAIEIDRRTAPGAVSARALLEVPQ